MIFRLSRGRGLSAKADPTTAHHAATEEPFVDNRFANRSTGTAGLNR